MAAASEIQELASPFKVGPNWVHKPAGAVFGSADGDAGRLVGPILSASVAVLLHRERSAMRNLLRPYLFGKDLCDSARVCLVSRTKPDFAS